MQGWLVVKSKHQQEAWAAENIARQSSQVTEVFLAKIAERVKGAGKLTGFRVRYLFPKFLFVKLSTERWRFLLGTYGVKQVLMVGGNPAYVQDHELDKLRKLQDADGLIHLPSLTEAVRFKHGDTVLVNSGVYKGYVGLYDGQAPKDRERILLDYLGRKTPVMIDTEALSKV